MTLCTKLLPICLLALMITSIAAAPDIMPEKAMTYYYAIWCGQDKATALMYDDAVRRYSRKYGIPSKYIARQIFAESRYDYRCVSKTGCRGPSQLEPNKYNTAFMRETDEYQKCVPIIEQFHYIYPSVEVQCRLWSIYYKAYSNYISAAVAYWAGMYSDEMKQYKSGAFNFNETKYYKIIFVDGYLEEHCIMAK